MKTLGLRMLALFLLMVGVMAVRGQERDAEVPGDNFSLEGALELFKKSESPEQFEKMLNAQDSKVNNLDLNGDGYTDYIRVIDRNEGNIHTFTMQAVISDTEVQDVAVITLEKLVNGKAVLQIIGDEDVYGMETIIEPTREVFVNAGTSTTQELVDVWAWPSVQYVYSPSYVVWISPWSWSVRPIWWSHWHPVVYYHYDSYWRPYRPYYTQCYSPRIVYASHIYRPYRSTSVIVHRRHETQITRYRSTHRDTYVRNRNESNSNPRYSNNPERRRPDGVSADRSTVRPRSNDGDNVTRTSTREEVRNTRPTERNKTERNVNWNDNSVQRERSDNVTRTREEVRDTRPTERNTTWNERPVQRERSESDVVKRERSVEQPRNERTADRTVERNTSVQRERPVSSPEPQRTTTQPRQEQPQRERVSTPSRSSESRESSPERSGRSSGSKSDSGSSQSQGRKRSR